VEGPDTLVATAVYQPEPLAAAAARRFVRDTLQSWVATGADADGNGLVDDAVLLTSELVTNAVVHAGTQVQVTCRLTERSVEVVVRDGQPASLVPEPPDVSHGVSDRTSGRGLLLPAALASAWGVTYGRTAKAVWFRIGLGGPGMAPGEDPDGFTESDPAGPAALTHQFRQAVAVASARQAAPGSGCGGAGTRWPAGPGYQELLQQTVESARAAVAADAACALLAGEDGELRPRAAAGMVPPGPPPAAITVPFVVDGRVTGLLAATRSHADGFRDSEVARLQEIADRAGPGLERARLADLERIRRERIGALAAARDLLARDLGPDKIMALAGEAVVPRLSSWCAVLLADAPGTPSRSCEPGTAGRGAPCPGGGQRPSPALGMASEPGGADVPGVASRPGEADGPCVASQAGEADGSVLSEPREANHPGMASGPGETDALGAASGPADAGGSGAAARGMSSPGGAAGSSRPGAPGNLGGPAVPGSAAGHSTAGSPWAAGGTGTASPAGLGSPSGPGSGFRVASVRHLDESRAPALAWVLGRMCSGRIPGQRLPRAAARPRPAWCWPLAGAAEDRAAPSGARELAGDTACCFPFPIPGGGAGVLAVGSSQGERLPRDVAALAADLAWRLGVALGNAALTRV
jgi:anti-sigma regulatory factor (Ser/Thr protein kinase)